MRLVSAVVELSASKILVEIQHENGEWVAEAVDATGSLLVVKQIASLFPSARRMESSVPRCRFRLEGRSLLAAVNEVWRLLARYHTTLSFWVRANESGDPVFKFAVSYPELSVLAAEPDEYEAFIKEENINACIGRLTELREVVNATFEQKRSPMLKICLEPAASQDDTFEASLSRITAVLAEFEHGP